MSWLMAIRSTLLVKNVVWVGRLFKLDTRLSTGKPPIDLCEGSKVPPYFICAGQLNLDWLAHKERSARTAAPFLPSPPLQSTCDGTGKGGGRWAKLVFW